MRLSEMRNGSSERSGIALKPIEPPSQRCLEILQFRKELVVGNGSLGFPPDVFDGIELGRVGRQEMELNDIFLAFEPPSDLG